MVFPVDFNESFEHLGCSCKLYLPRYWNILKTNKTLVSALNYDLYEVIWFFDKVLCRSRIFVLCWFWAEVELVFFSVTSMKLYFGFVQDTLMMIEMFCYC